MESTTELSPPGDQSRYVATRMPDALASRPAPRPRRAIQLDLRNATVAARNQRDRRAASESPTLSPVRLPSPHR